MITYYFIPQLQCKRWWPRVQVLYAASAVGGGEVEGSSRGAALCLSDLVDVLQVGGMSAAIAVSSGCAAGGGQG